LLAALIRRVVKIKNVSRSKIYCIFYKIIYPGFTYQNGVFLDEFVRIKITDGGEISLARNVKIERNSTLVAKRGRIVIGSCAFIGEGSIIVSNSEITIGQDCLIAAGATIRDQDHCMEDLDTPIRQQGTLSAPITIGRDVWLGAKVTILKGVQLGDQSVVGANSVVTRSLPSRAIAVGSPARLIRKRSPSI